MTATDARGRRRFGGRFRFFAHALGDIGHPVLRGPDRDHHGNATRLSTAAGRGECGHALAPSRRQITRPHRSADSLHGQYRQAAEPGRDVAFGRRPAADDFEGGFAAEFEIVASQQGDGRIRAVVGGGEANVAFCILADLPVPASAFDAPVIVELDASGDDRTVGAEPGGRDRDWLWLQRAHRLRPPVGNLTRLGLIVDRDRIPPLRKTASRSPNVRSRARFRRERAR